MKKLFTSIFIIIAIISCSRSDLDMALNLAGDNRSELERVLDHYSSQKDSLKLKAAIFLIKNMPGHYSYAEEVINQYYKEIDPILKNDSLPVDIYEEKLAVISNKFYNLKYKRVMDVEIITSNFLIYNIDKAFEDWANPLAQHLTFEEFCEALLPYKSTELQSLDHWRDSLKMRFHTEIPYPEVIEYSSTPYHRYNQVLNTIKKNIKFTIYSQSNNRFQRPLSASNMFYIRRGVCSNYLDINCNIMRSHGVPVYREFYPEWGKTNNTGHSFLTVVNKNGINLPYNHTDDINYSGYLNQEVNIPKVYRTTYAINDNRKQYYKEAKFHVQKLGLFVKDITDNYYSTSDIKIKINRKELGDKYVYLSIFSNGDWRQLDCIKQKKGIASFEKVGRNNLYIIQGFNDGELTAISDPFILKMNGDIIFIKSDNNTLQSMALTRKHCNYTHLIIHRNNAFGIIEASNSSNFSIRDTLCNIDPPGSFSHISSTKSYRYWRFVPNNPKLCNIAELQFYKQDTIVKGDIITNITNTQIGEEVERTFDGDWLANVNSRNVDNPWIGLDFKEPISIDKVLCAPRSDDNNIHIGDKYELRYWNDYEWKLVGTKIAEDSPLRFDSIPSNAVYLLNNISRGKQTRIFTYENDKQVWW